MNRLSVRQSKLNWQKSSYCTNGSCIELSYSEDGTVYVRDGKQRDGAQLAVSTHVWRDFLSAVKAGIQP